MAVPIVTMLVALAAALLLAFNESGSTNAVDSWMEAFQLIHVAGLFWCIPAFLAGGVAACLLALGPYLLARRRPIPLFSDLGPTFTLIWFAVMGGSTLASVALLAAVMLYKVG